MATTYQHRYSFDLKRYTDYNELKSSCFFFAIFKIFERKQITKTNVVDDMVNSNKILYGKDEKPDHCIVIKYIPYVGK